MKKMILLIMLLCGALSVHAKQLTKPEKQEMLKQFIQFQNAVRNGDISTIKSSILFPLHENSTINPLLGKTGSDKPDFGDKKLTPTLFDQYQKNALTNLKFVTLIKIEPQSLVIQKYLHPKTNRQYKYDNKGQYCYYLQGNKKIRVNDNFNAVAYRAFIDDHSGQLIVAKSQVSSPCDENEEPGYGEYFIFQLINNKLRIVNVGVAG